MTNLVEFSKIRDKVIGNKHKLKNKRSQRVYINEVMIKKEQEEEKQLRKRPQEKKNRGNAEKHGQNKIVINGNEWRQNSPTEKLELATAKN